MKPRSNPRVATVRDYAVALALLLLAGGLFVVVSIIGTRLNLPEWLMFAAGALVLAAYPVALGWEDARAAIRRHRGRCARCG